MYVVRVFLPSFFCSAPEPWYSGVQESAFSWNFSIAYNFSCFRPELEGHPDKLTTRSTFLPPTLFLACFVDPSPGGFLVMKATGDRTEFACDFGWVSFFFLFFKIFYLFLDRGEEREKERERNINVWLPLIRPLLGTWPATQACVLTGNPTSDPLLQSQCSIHRATPARVGEFLNMPKAKP